MANLPKYNVENLSFGCGILYLAPYDTANDKPVYPEIDVGAVRPGATLRITRDILDVTQGAPEVIIKSFVRSETVEFNITSIEWNLENIKRALGGGYYDDTKKILRFGGSMDLDMYSLRFVHQMPNGDIIELKLWRVNPTGEIEVSFASDDVHGYAMNFRGLPATRTWAVDAPTYDLGTGDGTTTTFSGTLTPIVEKNTVSVKKNGTEVATDDGNGNITGADVSGTINYNTGEIEVTFGTAPASGDSITVDYKNYELLDSSSAIVEIQRITS